MAQHGPRLVVPIDVKRKPLEQKVPLHNRWHPEIPPVAEAAVGEVFRVEMVDFSGGGITKEYTAKDIKFADPFILSSPIISMAKYGPSMVVPIDVKKPPPEQKVPSSHPVAPGHTARGGGGGRRGFQA
ncbi:Acetamidase/Formamidase [Parasponia andersonii]|uniref:Acetamidase/Formamidase n=1 Tax=Parasponia andersonii TaxID=3476 RepID=A0A2P5D0B5_PARAD|nr:Acetamidase/Formamidase [Parasponia andersonii]